MEAVKLLLHFKADPFVLNEQGLSPLQASAVCVSQLVGQVPIVCLQLGSHACSGERRR